MVAASLAIGTEGESEDGAMQAFYNFQDNFMGQAGNPGTGRLHANCSWVGTISVSASSSQGFGIAAAWILFKCTVGRQVSQKKKKYAIEPLWVCAKQIAHVSETKNTNVKVSLGPESCQPTTDLSK